MAAADLMTLYKNLAALQRACHILEAVVDSTFACSRRSRAWVQRVARHLPLGDWFAINGVSAEHRQEWLDAMFRGRRAKVQGHRDHLLQEKNRILYFEIREAIMLGFFNGREQYDRHIEPGQGHLMFDGADIHWVFEGQRRISDTINEAILIWLRDGSIEGRLGPAR